MNFKEREQRKAWLYDFLIPNMDANVAITLTFKQAVKHENGSLEYITRSQASSNIRHFLNLLNREIYGSTATRRHGNRLAVVSCIEGGDQQDALEKRMHVHMAIKLPDSLDVTKDWDRMKFRQLVSQCWQRTIWGYEMVDIQPCNDPKGWLRYMMKDGPDSIDLENVRF